MTARLKTSREPRRPGWPKLLKCLGCARPRSATSPSDRLCDACRASARRVEARYADAGAR